MPCYDPLTAYRGFREGGGLGIVFSLNQAWPRTQEPIRLPCGQCIGCRLDRARMWAARCIMEAKLHENNCYITCTYNPDSLPPGASLRPNDVTTFFKRLRKKYGKIRYFQCGEYGENFSRPHHHAILFGFDFPDKELFYTRKNMRYYRSNSLDEIWSHGLCVISDVTFDSAMYVAKYVTKKITGPLAKDHYQGRHPEYVTMSRRPGIASDWYDKYKKDLYTADKFVVEDGFILKPPRYFDEKYKLEEEEMYKQIKEARIEKAKENFEGHYRRATREKHAHLKLKRKERSYEKANSQKI